MELTFVDALGHTFSIEVDADMDIGTVMVLLEAEANIPVAELSISHDGRELTDPKATLRESGVGEKAHLLFRRKVSTASGQTMVMDHETMRLQLLGDPALMNQVRESNPELADAAQSNPARFAELLAQTTERAQEADAARQREIATLNADPFDIEAQRRIEEAIRQQAVLENMEHALEYSPESFGRVTMLYIPVEVNSHPVKAFVDSGAQQTIMSPECAEACGIMRLVDQRFAGIARGVGTAKILGRVHSAQMKLSDLHLPCAFTIMEGRDVDLLLGLDMLKAHQACIDLGRNVLRIQGREVKFLSEHELPDKARIMDTGDEEASVAGPSSLGAAAASPQGSAFPGGGNTLGSRPGGEAALNIPANVPRPARQPAPAVRHPEESIRALENLGATREQAISSLDQAGGNVEWAASLMFQM